MCNKEEKKVLEQLVRRYLHKKQFVCIHCGTYVSHVLLERILNPNVGVSSGVCVECRKEINGDTIRCLNGRTKELPRIEIQTRPS